MKKVTVVLGVFLSLFLIACEGPVGPPGFDGLDGPQGPPGQDGEDGIQAQVFEVDNVNFTYRSIDNIFEAPIVFQDFTDFETVEGDAVLVYRFDGVVDFEDGSSEDSWVMIPQNFFLESGTIQYVPSHTSVDVNILIEGNFDLSTLSTDFTDNQLFRIAILPRQILTNGKMDQSNIKVVMSSVGLEEDDVQKIKLD